MSKKTGVITWLTGIAFLAVAVLVQLLSLLNPARAQGTTPPKKEAVGEVWLTTPDQKSLLQKQKNSLRISAKADPFIAHIIEVDPNKMFQEIDGFGAAMTGSSAYLMEQKMTPAQRDALVKELFTYQSGGIGMNYMRTNIGSSDFSLGSNYSYDDPASGSDPEVSAFSLDKDRRDLIPAIKQVMAANPKLKLMGSPWSAPAWMKTSGSMIKGSLRTDAYPAFARYFVKYVQGFAKDGIPVDAITIQNEPQFEPEGYPGMRMTAPEHRDFIKLHLGPAFAKAGIKTKVMVFDHNWDDPDYAIEILNDPIARKFVAGSAFHCYKGSVEAMSKVHDAHPDKDLYFTECSGGEWAPGFANNLRGGTNLIIGTTRNWSRNVLLWNMALDQKAGPTNGGCMNCRGLVTIDSAGSGTVTRNVDYYVIGHASRFVKLGARRIFSTEDKNLPNVAFRNADGSLVLLAVNMKDEAQKFQVRAGKEYFTYTLPAGALATLVWK